MSEVIAEKKLNFLKDWVIPIIIAITIALLINKYVIFKIEIPSESMVPTLNVGDKLFATRVYNAEKLKRGDLVIFYSKERDELMIKRLIGLPNESVVIRNGEVCVEGEVLTEDYVKNQDYFSGDYLVPEGEYFFLGDNRTNSLDSRGWNDTFISAEDIRGKAIIKVHPFSDFGFVK